MKNKLKIIIYFLFIFNAISCNQNKQAEEIKTIEPIHKKSIDKNKIITELEPQVVALNFYKWYLKNIYLKKYVESPDIVLTKDSVYVLDATKHKDFLNKSGYFSPKFYDNEIAVLKNCENQLKLVKWKEVEESGVVNPADFVKGNECNFTFYKVWTNGQGEAINKAEIDRYITKENTALVVLKLSDSLQGGFFSKPYISMVKENGKWKISKINASFE